MSKKEEKKLEPEILEAQFVDDSGDDGDNEDSDDGYATMKPDENAPKPVPFDKKNPNDVPNEFTKIMKDLLKDLLTTFPEYGELFNSDPLFKNVFDLEPCSNKMKQLFDYCSAVFPERFFDILYQNDEIFKDDKMNTKFLPNIDFKDLWKEDLGDRTRTIIWKYLQLILFSIVGSQTEGKSFGDTAKFFEAIDETEFKTKLEETINQMADIFDSSNNSSTDCSNINIKDLPNAEKLHDHITGLLEGHLGRLAKEIAEETASEMNLNLTDVTSVSDVFQQLFQNPGKLMKIVKKVGTKLDDKLKSGEIKESELLKEATELMGKMGKTPGMKNMNSLFGEMGLPIGRKSKINKSAFQAHMQRQMRAAKMRERMKSKLVQRKSQQQSIKPTSQISNSWLPDSYNQEKPLRFKKKKKKKKKTKK